MSRPNELDELQQDDPELDALIGIPSLAVLTVEDFIGQESPVATLPVPSAFPWTRQFIADVATHASDLPNVLKRHRMPMGVYLSFKDNPAYLAELKGARESILGEGVTFKQKAMMLADKHLATVDDMVADGEVPAKERVSLIQSLAKWAGHEPKTGGMPEGNSFSVIINMEGNQTKVSLDE